MQRPENYTLFAELLFGGAAFLLAIAVVFSLWTCGIVLRGRRLALKICVPPLLTILLIVLSLIIGVGFSSYYSASYGYRLLPGEPSGPLGTTGDSLGVLFGCLLVIVYMLFLAFLILRVLLSPNLPKEIEIDRHRSVRMSNLVSW
jgi:hypothetical protein